MALNFLSAVPRASAIGVLALTFSASAMASEDDHNYPGAACQPQTNAQNILRDSLGRMLNASPAAQTWICPVEREAFGRNSVEFASIVVIDNNVASGDPNVSCSLVARTRTGGACNSLNRSTAGGPGTTTLSYAAGNVNFSTCTDAYYYFLCSIPGTFGGRQSGVVSYKITENENED
jgi:hypothetical protein